MSGGGGGKVVFVVLALLVVVVGGLFVLTSGDDDDDSDGGNGSVANDSGGNSESNSGGEVATPDTPEGAVRAFFAAAADGDCEALSGLVVQNTDGDEMLQNCSSAPDEFAGIAELVDIGAVDGPQPGTTAVVEVTFTYTAYSGGGDIEGEATTSVGRETTTSAVSLVEEEEGGTWRLDVSTLGS